MRILITGSSGLIGSEAVKHFSQYNCDIVGIDNNGRKDFFGNEGDTSSIQESLKNTRNYQFHSLDITNIYHLRKIIWADKFDLVIHCAAQPSHDKSAENPAKDFQINAMATVSLLDEIRQHSPKATFIFCSTNKVYGDGPNYVPMTEGETRFEYADNTEGINSSFNTGNCKIRTPFGVSKLSADCAVQEYGNYFGMNTAVFRLGCVTGSAQKGVELHGFLNYLCKCAREDKEFTIYGYKGKQVRDIIHASDVVSAMHEFWKEPSKGAVFNMGGGKENSVSVLEAIAMVEELTGKQMNIKYSPDARKGDHMLYITDLRRFKVLYPCWKITKNLKFILEDLLNEDNSAVS
jgi:CDP-paratose 2-epimerase